MMLAPRPKMDSEDCFRLPSVQPDAIWIVRIDAKVLHFLGGGRSAARRHCHSSKSASNVPGATSRSDRSIVVRNAKMGGGG